MIFKVIGGNDYSKATHEEIPEEELWEDYNQITCSYCGYKCNEGVHKCCNDEDNNHCGVCCREIED